MMITRLLQCALVSVCCSMLIMGTGAASNSIIVDEPNGDCSKCTLKSRTAVTAAAMEKLRPLCGRTFTKPHDNKYKYTLGICKNVGADSNGIVGMEQKEMAGLGRWNLGLINNTDIMTGDNWIYLEYGGGSSYQHACNYEQRKVVIMITCKQDDQEGELTFLGEDTNKTSDCHYIFQLGHKAACSQVTQEGGLSAGAIICIVLFTVTGTYLLLGMLYMRCVKDAKGWKQIPNQEFWKDFGNLQADGCDLICRCGGKNTTYNHYHGIGDYQIESANDEEVTDEHLLPM